jgi:hypothetical protein
VDTNEDFDAEAYFAEADAAMKQLLSEMSDPALQPYRQEEAAKRRWRRKWLVFEDVEWTPTLAVVEAGTAEEAIQIARSKGIEPKERPLKACPLVRQLGQPDHCCLCGEALEFGRHSALCDFDLDYLMSWMGGCVLIPRG